MYTRVERKAELQLSGEAREQIPFGGEVKGSSAMVYSFG